MKRRIPQTVATLITALIACQLAYGQHVVYPLHVGDRWEYDEPNGLHPVVVVAETLMPNGLMYAKIRVQAYGYQRQSGEQVLRYFDGGETIIYDFSRASGDTIATEDLGYDIADIILEEMGAKELFGASRRFWQFFCSTRQGRDTLWVDTIVDSIGLYRREWFGGPSVLRGASLDGRQYGILSTDVRWSDNVAATTTLYQNYPNPYNLATVISYRLPTLSGIEGSAVSDVRLVVYDLLGREVSVLVNEKKPAGSYTVSFHGPGLPSGVYVYRLSAGSVSLTKRMILMK
jgi:hypothetical protein